MKIYSEEKSIANLLQSKATASLVIPISVTEDKPDVFIESLKDMNSFASNVKKALARVSEETSPDLLYGSAILVTTVLNKNDDLFLPDETWAARNTPVHQPYNNDHVEEDIIGHIIASRVLDKNDKVVASEEPPDFFNIEVDFVVYKGIFPAIAKEIAEKGPKGKKFVSMEAKFSNFDYALIESNTNVKIYARNEDTAFLTKYLKAYGGEGKYKDQRIGRVLRDIRFVGMGNVDVPANPASEFTKLESYESASLKDLKSESKTIIYITKGNIMALTLEQAEKVIADLNVKLATFESKADEHAKAALDAEKTKSDVATQKFNEATAQLTATKAELETTKATLAEKTSKLDEIQKSAKAADRIAELKKLNIEVTDEAKLKSIANLSDDAFTSLIDFTKTFAKTKADDMDGDVDAAKKAKDKKDKEDKDNKDAEDAKAEKVKKDKEKVDAAAVASATQAASAALGTVIASTSADLTRTSGDNSSTISEEMKTAAKLVGELRKGHKIDRFGRKPKNKE